jgi:hypothetical protein
MNLTVDTLEFHLDKAPKKFVVISNLPQDGLTIEAAFSEWINHSADITPESLCRYIRSMSTNIVCFTQEEFFEWRLPHKSRTPVQKKII